MRPRVSGWLEPHLTDDDLHDHYRRAGDAVERSHWLLLWLLASGMMASSVNAVNAVTGDSAYWIGRIARPYNTGCPDGVRGRRHAMRAGRPAVPSSHLTELRAAFSATNPTGTSS